MNCHRVALSVIRSLKTQGVHGGIFFVGGIFYEI